MGGCDYVVCAHTDVRSPHRLSPVGRVHSISLHHCTCVLGLCCVLCAWRSHVQKYCRFCQNGLPISFVLRWQAHDQTRLRHRQRAVQPLSTHASRLDPLRRHVKSRCLRVEMPWGPRRPGHEPFVRRDRTVSLERAAKVRLIRSKHKQKKKTHTL